MMLSKPLWTTLGALLALAGATAPAVSFDNKDYAATHIIVRDVVIVGGGSSGTYTAVRLRDSGKSVVVVEKKGNLGGHAQTFTAPNGYAIDYGVRVFNQVKVVKDYFARLNLSWAVGGVAGDLEFVDYSTGEAVAYRLPDAPVLGAAFQAYIAQLSKYPELNIGFNLTYPVAEDLLLSYREFAHKYDIGPMVYTSFMHQGLVPLLDTPMLYVFKYINSYLIEAKRIGYLVLQNHNVQSIYRAAHQVLGDDNVLLNSFPLGMDRSSPEAARVVVQTPEGPKLIIAKKLVSAIPPTLGSLSAYDLTTTEKELFSKWTKTGYYAGILRNTGLNSSVNYFFAQPQREFAVPELPGPYLFGATGAPGYTNVLFGSPTIEGDEHIKGLAEEALARVQADRGLAQTSPDWAAFQSHSPFNIQVSRDEIKAGFYKKLFELNGQNHTFYNSATFQGWSSTGLWEFTEEYLLPLILSALG